MFHLNVRPRSLVAVLLGLLVLGLAAASSQDPAKEQKGTDPLGASPLSLTSRKEALEEGLVGCWTLMLYENPTQAVDPRNVKGFLTFQDGYATSWWQANVLRKVMFGNTPDVLIQSQVMRYRVSDFLELETAPIHSLDNFQGELRVGGPMEPATHQILLQDEDLVLEKIDGTRLTYRKVASDRLPERANARLRETRGGRVPLPRSPVGGR